MNWYKKAQLQETLPYFKEFEEYGEYIPNEDSLNNKLNSMGLSIVSTIDSGDSGVAYLLSSGDVLKITTNSQEGQVASYLQNNPHSSIVGYKDVWKEGDLYYIIMEYIDTMVSDVPEMKDVFNMIENVLNRSNCFNPRCAYNILFSQMGSNFIPRHLRSIIKDYLLHLQTVPFKVFDFLNSNNIGLKDGQIKFFDIT